MRQVFAGRNKTFYKERGLFVILTCLVGAFFLYLLFFSPLLAGAQTTEAPAAGAQNFGLNDDFNVGVGQKTDLKDTVADVINVVLGFLGIIAVLLIMYAGWLYLTARGNEEQVTRAKLVLRNAVIGLVIILSAWGVATFVINQLRGGGLGGPGADGDAGGDSSGGLSGAALSDQFILREFQTAHRGPDPRRSVARCSDVQAQFSHILQSQALADPAVRGNLKVLQTKTGVNAEGGGGTVQNPPVVAGVGLASVGNALEFELDHKKIAAATLDLWEPFSEYEVQLPKTITDFAGNPLTDCPDCATAPGGANYFVWRFTTDDQIDETRPELRSAYPSFPGTADYPDRDVDRKTTFVLEFSEPVKLGDATLTLEERSGETDATVRRTITKDFLDIQFIGSQAIRFQVSDRYRAAFDNAPGFLEPTAWYRIFIDGITDLCGNQLNTRFDQWIFRTNALTPGIAFSYPASGSALACPATDVLVQFQTSMYDIRTNSCAVDARSGFGGLVRSGTGVGNRVLRVSDSLPPDASARPAQFCKTYRFGSALDLLSPNTPYAARVVYFNQAEGTTKTHQWSFAVNPEGQCVNAPYISALAPQSGPWGRCLTVVGNNFGAGGTVYATLAPKNRSALNGAALSTPQDTYWSSGWKAQANQFALAGAGCKIGAPEADGTTGALAAGTLRLTAAGLTLRGKLTNEAVNQIQARLNPADSVFVTNPVLTLTGDPAQVTALGDGASFSGTNLTVRGRGSVTSRLELRLGSIAGATSLGGDEYTINLTSATVDVDGTGLEVVVNMARSNQCWGNQAIATTLNNLDALSAGSAAFAGELAPQLPNKNSYPELELEVMVSVPNPLATASGAAAIFSNPMAYRLKRNQPAYAGPCLTHLDPGSGNRGDKVTLTGSGFAQGFDRNSSGQEIRLAFLNNTVAPVDTWRDTGLTADSQIIIKVPETGVDGLVAVETIYGRSNGLLYDVRLPSEDAAPSATFSISAASPRPGMAAAFQTTLPIHPPLAAPVVYDAAGQRTAGTVALHQCVSDSTVVYDICRGKSTAGYRSATAVLPKPLEQCLDITDLLKSCSVVRSTPESIALVAPVSPDPLALTRRDMAPQTGLLANTEYRAIVYGGADGIRSAGALTMFNPNYDSDFDASRVLDAFSWRFATDQNGLPSTPQDDKGLLGNPLPGTGTTNPVLPLLVESFSPGALERACPAIIAEVIVKGVINYDSLADNFYLRRTGAATPLAGEVYAYSYGANHTRLTFIPKDSLPTGADYQIILRAGATGLRSQSQGHLVASSLCPAADLEQTGQCALDFSTIAGNDQPALSQCEASDLTLEPVNPLYFCAGDNCPGDAASAPGHQRNFDARLAARNGQALQSGTAFIWSLSDPTLLAFYLNNAGQQQAFTIQPKNGDTNISVTTTIKGKVFSATTAARIFLCAQAWPEAGAAPFIDPDTNFSLFYCRDQGQAGTGDDLPEMKLQVIINSQGFDNKIPPQPHTAVPGLIKEFLYTFPNDDGNNDALGIRVLQNSEHDNISEWYRRQNFTQGSPQTITVDGYSALRDGRTIYVMAPNDSDGENSAAPNSIYTNVYLLSLSDGARPGSQAVFNQLGANWHLAANILRTDNREALRRDTRRLTDLRGLANIMASRSISPQLNSGSFIKNQSVSVWPSWAGSLAADLGQTPPVDPVNKIICGSSYDQATCFNKDANPSFQCLAGSQVYQYQATPGATFGFTLQANLEYQGLSWAHPASGGWRVGANAACVNTYYSQ